MSNQEADQPVIYFGIEMYNLLHLQLIWFLMPVYPAELKWEVRCNSGAIPVAVTREVNGHFSPFTNVVPHTTVP
jgi:hypothetical protein